MMEELVQEQDFFNFLENKETGQHVPAIITNKHVISGAIKGKLIFTKANDKGEPLDNEHLPIYFDNFEKHWIFRDSPDVDLCALPIAAILTQLDLAKQNIFFIALNKDIIPNKETIEDTSALEEILMIGYPNGIWDTYNNKPLLRKGITATHPKFDYCGR